MRIQPFCLAAVLGLAASALGAADWPQHRGPQRLGTTSEEHLLDSWGPGQPREVWRRAVGAGYSGVAASGQRAFTMAADGDIEKVICLDTATGDTLWETAVGPSKESDLGDTGPRSTPTVDGGVVFTASSAGTVIALSSEDGRVLWKHEFDGDAPRFGYSVSPLVDGELLIVESGATDEQPGILALDKRTGEIRWSALTGPSGYSSPIAVEIAGVRQYVFFRRVGNAVVSVSTSGEPLWNHPTAALAAITTPVFYPPDRIFVASADDGFGGSMLRITKSGDGFAVEELWNERLMRNHFNTAVLVGDHLYGFDNGTFRCLDAGTGEKRWARRGFGKGSLIASGELLFVLSDAGVLALVAATPDEYRELGRTTAMSGRAWTAPSLSDGRVYVRDFDELVSFDVSDPSAAEIASPGGRR
jgi:outer membrane protein assembly factor BamB